jgi:hypothetical protein
MLNLVFLKPTLQKAVKRQYHLYIIIMSNKFLMKYFTLFLMLIIAEFINCQPQPIILKSSISAQLPNKFFFTDSGFYGLRTHCVNFNFFKHTPQNFDIVKYNNYEEKFSLISIAKLEGNKLKGYQLMDFAEINSQPVIIAAKEEKNNVVLSYFSTNNFNTLNEFGRLEYTNFNAPNTGRLGRDFDDIQNIYMNKSPDGKSFIFYTYLKNKEKLINLKCYNEGLTLSWEKELEIPVSDFRFGHVEKVVVLNNQDVIISLLMNNKAYLYKYVFSDDKLEEIITESLNYAVRNSEIIYKDNSVFHISVLEKKVSQEFRGISITKLDVETNTVNTFNIVDPYTESESLGCKISNVLSENSKLYICIEDNDRLTTQYDDKSHFISTDSNLTSYSYFSIHKPISSYFENEGLVGSHSYLLESSDGFKFLANVGNEYVKRIENNQKNLYEKIVDTKIGIVQNEKISFQNIQGFENNFLIRSIVKVNKNKYLIEFSKEHNENLKLGILVF